MPKTPNAPLGLLLAVALATSSVSARAEDPCDKEELWTFAPVQGTRIQVENEIGSIELELGEPGSDFQVRGAFPEIAIHVEENTRGWQLNVKRETSDESSNGSECGGIILRLPAGSDLDLSLITDGGDILIPEVSGPLQALSDTGHIQVGVGSRAYPMVFTTTTGPITLRVNSDTHLAVDLATSGEITVDFSVFIDYVYHQEPAKLGKVVIGDGLTSARVNSRRGHISVLRRLP